MRDWHHDCGIERRSRSAPVDEDEGILYLIEMDDGKRVVEDRADSESYDR